jgi:uncharacterized protein (TIGR02284 family)
MQATSTHAIDTLNSLLRGELAATETYQQAMAKIKTEPAASSLRSIRDEHRDGANQLRQYVHHFGGQPDQDSGVWGAFAKLVEGSAKLFGEAAALKALKEGEEHGINAYEDALKDEGLPAECKWLINSQLLPQARAHIAALDRLMGAES